MTSETIVAEFLFGKWLLKALYKDGNKLGLVTDQPIRGVLQNNLEIVKEVLTALISSDVDYEIFMSSMPQQLSQICDDRRNQAKIFLQNLLETKISDNYGKGSISRSKKVIQTESILASWSDISIIFDFFKHYTQDESVD